MYCWVFLVWAGVDLLCSELAWDGLAMAWAGQGRSGPATSWAERRMAMGMPCSHGLDMGSVGHWLL